MGVSEWTAFVLDIPPFSAPYSTDVHLHTEGIHMYTHTHSKWSRTVSNLRIDVIGKLRNLHEVGAWV
ncbi:hypothetical protein C8R48DRAFT_738344 [Suillus tomentosus]|nr:hypothetical protein C8R48DRAFT_738344 [Suillus tomentosus]